MFDKSTEKEVESYSANDKVDHTQNYDYKIVDKVFDGRSQRLLGCLTILNNGKFGLKTTYKHNHIAWDPGKQACYEGCRHDSLHIGTLDADIILTGHFGMHTISSFTTCLVGAFDGTNQKVHYSSKYTDLTRMLKVFKVVFVPEIILWKDIMNGYDNMCLGNKDMEKPLGPHGLCMFQIGVLNQKEGLHMSSKKTYDTRFGLIYKEKNSSDESYIMFNMLRYVGYLFETLGSPFTCFVPLHLGALLRVHLTLEYVKEENEKLCNDIDLLSVSGYKEVMKHIKFGLNGGIIISLILWAMEFHEVFSAIESREDQHDYVLLETHTPGQREIFMWSALGAIISEAFASTFQTVIAFVLDIPQSTSTTTFMSKMFHLCSILYKKYIIRLLAPLQFVVEWIGDLGEFNTTLESDSVYTSVLNNFPMVVYVVSDAKGGSINTDVYVIAFQSWFGNHMGANGSSSGSVSSSNFNPLSLQSTPIIVPLISRHSKLLYGSILICIDVEFREAQPSAIEDEAKKFALFKIVGSSPSLINRETALPGRKKSTGCSYSACVRWEKAISEEYRGISSYPGLLHKLQAMPRSTSSGKPAPLGSRKGALASSICPRKWPTMVTQHPLQTSHSIVWKPCKNPTRLSIRRHPCFLNSSQCTYRSQFHFWLQNGTVPVEEETANKSCHQVVKPVPVLTREHLFRCLTTYNEFNN